MEFVSLAVFCRVQLACLKDPWMKLPNVTISERAKESAEGKLNRTRQEPAFRKPPPDRPTSHEILCFPHVLRQQLFLKTEE